MAMAQSRKHDSLARYASADWTRVDATTRSLALSYVHKFEVIIKWVVGID